MVVGLLKKSFEIDKKLMVGLRQEIKWAPKFEKSVATFW